MIKGARTKIIATLGPKTNSGQSIEKLFKVGVDIFRLNLSHSNVNEHKKIINTIRTVTDEKAAILLDLPGPKIRIGQIKKKLFLLPKSTFTLTTDNNPNIENSAVVNYKNLHNDVKPGQKIYLADGTISLMVKEIIDNDIVTTVISGGQLTSGKGINVPGSKLRLFFPTEKDLQLIDQTIDLEPDFYGLSFVRRAKDIITIKKKIKDSSNNPHLIAKIEHKDALNKIQSILHEVDGLMIARGDLGVEFPIEEIPLLQKQLIDQARLAGRPVIVATQILSSMVYSPRPTRAEANDIANAILDGTDALMLSEETAIGDYPFQAVRLLEKIARATEKYLIKETTSYSSPEPNFAELLGESASIMCRQLDIAAILTMTRTGRTPRFIAKYRPAKPIITATPDETLFRKLKLIWGVTPLVISDQTSTDELIKITLIKTLEKELIKKTDQVLIIGGSLLGRSAKTNFMQILNVKKALEIIENNKRN